MIISLLMVYSVTVFEILNVFKINKRNYLNKYIIEHFNKLIKQINE